MVFVELCLTFVVLCGVSHVVIPVTYMRRLYRRRTVTREGGLVTPLSSHTSNTSSPDTVVGALY